MLDKIKQWLESVNLSERISYCFGFGGVFAALAVIQIIIKCVRPGAQPGDYVLLIILDIIIAAIFFALGIYGKNQLKNKKRRRRKRR